MIQVPPDVGFSQNATFPAILGMSGKYLLCWKTPYADHRRPWRWNIGEENALKLNFTKKYKSIVLSWVLDTMNLRLQSFSTQYTERRHLGKSCRSATIDPMQTFTGYSRIRVAHVLFGKYYRFACSGICIQPTSKFGLFLVVQWVRQHGC